MDADVRVKGAGSDCEGVPLGTGDFGDLDKEPLARFIFHAWFEKLDLHRVCPLFMRICRIFKGGFCTQTYHVDGG